MTEQTAIIPLNFANFVLDEACHELKMHRLHGSNTFNYIGGAVEMFDLFLAVCRRKNYE